ncbi:glycoside hydrolase [Lindgomyces ingoldianus]|uniref:Glycoside hydrolase n=1 Tax=Lindgomyces ingoldianus TaxID=673940 RepID=A0ACB6R0C6_9PLEO|nr:glycoside hydrolase [Lindgomyces ingoldianus]KAF2472487.1 glycoside hydrolase [Lindgomyces ingoldianus]
MKSALYAIALAATACSLCCALSIPQNDNFEVLKRGTTNLGLPSNGLTTNCISIGFLPSEGDSASPRYTMSQINAALGAKSSTYGWYAQIKSSSFDGSQLTAIMDDVKASGAVFVASVMPSINFNQISTSVADQVAAVMKKFTDEGIEVWLRFGHEMNWYVQDGTYHGTAADFVTAWKNIYNANCKGNSKVKCFWSPNCASAASLSSWWPGNEFVDIVGIDCYPKAGADVSGTSLFQQFYGDFYNTFSKPYNLPFAIGETGAGGSQKEGWLKQLVAPGLKKQYPNYVSMSWFEFDKEADFRIVMTDGNTLSQTKQTLLSGSGSCGGGEEGNTTMLGLGLQCFGALPVSLDV